MGVSRGVGECGWVRKKSVDDWGEGMRGSVGECGPVRRCGGNVAQYTKARGVWRSELEECQRVQTSEEE